jgi:hypothetical protein
MVGFQIGKIQNCNWPSQTRVIRHNPGETNIYINFLMWDSYIYNLHPLYIAYIHMKCFLTFSRGIPIYSLYSYEMFLNFFMWDSYIYGLLSHEMFLNFSMWNIKSQTFFKKLFSSHLCDPGPGSLDRSTPGPSLITILFRSNCFFIPVHMCYGVIDCLPSIVRYNPSSLAVLVLNWLRFLSPCILCRALQAFKLCWRNDLGAWWRHRMQETSKEGEEKVINCLF